MLKFQEEGSFAFVKVAQNCLKSGLSAPAVGALCILESSKNNPKKNFTPGYIDKILHADPHKKAALLELEKNGYITKHCYPSKKAGEFNWKVECDSFLQNTGRYGIIYHRADGTEKKGANVRFVHALKSSNLFLRIPKTIVLDTRLSLSSVGLYARLLFLCHDDPFLPSKDAIRKVSGMSAYEFNKAWRQLHELGYLNLEKISQRKYLFLLRADSLTVLKKPDAKEANKRVFFEINTKSNNIFSSSNSVDIHTAEELAQCLIAKRKYKGDMSFLLAYHGEPVLDELNKQLLRYFKKAFYKRIDYVNFMDQYRVTASGLHFIQDKISCIKSYVYKTVRNDFEDILNNQWVDYEKEYGKIGVDELTRLIMEPIARKLPERKEKKKQSIYFSYMHQNYDWDMINAIVAGE